MTKRELAERMEERRAWLPGKRIKLDFGGEGVILLDGDADRVSHEDGPADTTIRIGWADFEKLKAGDMDPMTAFMTGRIRVEGDMGNAMQLASVLSKLRSH